MGQELLNCDMLPKRRAVWKEGSQAVVEIEMAISHKLEDKHGCELFADRGQPIICVQCRWLLLFQVSHTMRIAPDTCTILQEKRADPRAMIIKRLYVLYIQRNSSIAESSVFEPL